MNKKTKITLGVGALVVFAGVLSSCNSFCSNTDVTHYLYAYDPLNNIYFNSKDDAIDYIEQTFKEQSSYDKENSTYDAGKVYFKNDDTKNLKDNESDFIKQVDGSSLYYVVPNNYVLKGCSTAVDSTTGNRGNIEYIFGLNSFTKSLYSENSSTGIILPAFSYVEELDKKVLKNIVENVSLYSNFGYEAHIDLNSVKNITLSTVTFEDLYGYSYSELKAYRKGDESVKLDDLLGNNSTSQGRVDKDGNKIRVGGRNYSLTTNLGYLKFFNKDDQGNYYANLEKWNNELVSSLGVEKTMSSNYLNAYKTKLNQKVSALKTCITINQGFYGHTSDDPLNDTVSIEGKAGNFWSDWGNAFSQHGFLEGLLVYPISYLVDYFAHSFGMNGWGQILSVLLVTVIVRLLFMAITLPSTISQQKQQYLQPELTKLQQKYPNSNTNDYEKQRLAQAQMALYKKYKVHPFLSFLTIFIQLPLFICVWNAMQGCAALSSDAVLGLRLSDTIWNVLSNFSGWPGNAGWWTALVLILLMSAGQVLSMLIPQWLNKKRMKSIQKTGVNPALDKQTKTMKYVQWGMIIFTIILGFTLPSAMGVYWLAGSIFNIVQSLIMHLIFSKKKGVNK